jgi:hypothetical protein
MASLSSPRIVRLATLLAGVAVVGALAGCVEQEAAPHLPTESGAPSEAPTSAPTTTPTDDPGGEAGPVDISCDDLVDPQAVYDFDPNYGLLDSWTPTGGSAAAEAVAADGIACRWVRESGGGTIDLSVARLDQEDIDAKKNAAFAESQMVPTYGDEAYFEVEGDVGTAIVFQGPYWLVISSVSFAEPGEPTPIIESALAALPAV